MAKDETKSNKLFWLDMEMSGLDVEKCKILEVACVVTDLDLNVLDEYQEVVFQPPEVLQAMDEWCTSTHGKSGLTAAVATGKTLEEVEQQMIAFTKKNFAGARAVLAGNSIWQDRKFVDAYLPRLAELLHYRMVDVSSFKEVLRNKFSVHFKKQDSHRARTDIYESIGELKHYLTFFNPNPEASPKSA